MSQSQIASAAHQFATTFLSRYGQPENALEQCELAARLIKLQGNDADLFIDRAVGHFVNTQFTGKGI
jgi:hypothetical protein